MSTAFLFPGQGAQTVGMGRDLAASAPEAKAIFDKANEILGLRLVTLHNLHFYLHLMTRVRAHLEAGTFESFRRTFVANYVPWQPEPEDARA